MASEPRCPTRFESQCSPSVAVDDKDADGSGRLFNDAVADPGATFACMARDVCDLLFRKATEVRKLTKVNIVIENYAGISEAFRTGTEATIRLSSSHLQDVANAHGDVRVELDTIFFYHATNIYQNDGGDGVANSWLVQAVANYVRHQAGLLKDSERRPGGNYDDGGNTSGFFFAWLDARYPDFVYELNQSLDPNAAVNWSPQVFTDITGQPADALWLTYQASL